MSADRAAFYLVAAAVIPGTLCPLIYAFRPFWKSQIGRAVMVSWVGLGLLVDISFLYMQFGDDYPGRDLVRLSVYTVIVAGMWMNLYALIRNILRTRVPDLPEDH